MDTRSGESAVYAYPNGSGFSGHEPGGPYFEWVKPTLDRVLGVILLAIASPVILVVSIVVLITLGRPVFFSQTRIGLGGEPFQLYKFRTMHPDRRQRQEPYSGEERRRHHKSSKDPRHTSVGRLLRSSRLDELPQLWNVVKGDMSLVGPRPEMPYIVANYEEWQHQRHLVKPGLTGLWQISDQNGKPMHECTEIDIEYLRRIGFFQDMSILARTPLAMLGRRRGH